ncbi:ligase-associated DNA damage response endonuclease PdeM [Novosphingobium humi]|uniref:Ligase-associated DNA damage response endonuclease PdeM n=2 Tax=Novosphingobium humi TaxID=2282397 RepID=A0ABY7U3S9_9SPHN|nr:ligase-associated DNA damage response endonuclease PdeM [Novosphingobium humi]WCT78939.1 ligase-associated DNA damage response endonuclease PdeM [Novosphingobium humi]
MQFAPFSFADHEWLISNSRAVYWPAQQALLVADLHLEKASWFAQTGQMLPPYDSRETLERLSAAAAMTGARRVLCLGDNFHDDDGPARMEPEAARLLGDLTRRLEVVWIVGNHDAGMTRAMAGDVVEDLMLDGIALRHEAEPGETGPEISGHYHPKLRLRVRGRMISRPCALRSENRLILPAFGALTGGMDAADPALIAALQPAKRVEAILCAAAKAAILPVWPA